MNVDEHAGLGSRNSAHKGGKMYKKNKGQKKGGKMYKKKGKWTEKLFSKCYPSNILTIPPKKSCDECFTNYKQFTMTIFWDQ